MISIDNTLEDKIKDEKRNPDLYSVYMAQASIRATNGQIFELLQYSLTGKIRYLWHYLSQVPKQGIIMAGLKNLEPNCFKNSVRIELAKEDLTSSCLPEYVDFH